MQWRGNGVEYSHRTSEEAAAPALQRGGSQLLSPHAAVCSVSFFAFVRSRTAARRSLYVLYLCALLGDR